jgi:uncharacterized membrane protein YgaE (UPF0421/DUF939 family)
MTGHIWTSGYTRLAALTALAAFVAYVLGEAIPFADPIPAAITAAIATRATFHHAAKETVFQIVGALLGAAIALAIVSVIGSSAIVILVLVLLCFALARILRLASPDESPFVAASMAVTVILVAGTNLTSEGALERFVGVAIGALCALAASAIVAPTKDTRVLIADIAALQDDLSDLLFRMSKGLREAPDRDSATALREEAVELRNRAIGLTARWTDLAGHARWSPRLDHDELQRIKQQLDATSVMSARVLSIAADLTAASGRTSTPLPPAALSPLADLMAMAADNMAAEDPSTSIGRTQAHEAVRVADQTAQIALIGGIVSNLNRINVASAESHDADADNAEDEHSAT